MLRDAVAMDTSLLGEKIIARTTTQRVISRVVKRRDGRFMRANDQVIGEAKGERRQGWDVHFMRDVCRVG
jgi:hypothetical protein